MNTPRILEVKIADEQERLRIILEDIRLNKEILKSTVDKNNELQEAIDKKTSEFNSLVERNIIVSQDTETRLKNLSDKELLIDKKSKDIDSKLDSLELALVSTKDEIKKRIDIFDKQYDMYQESLSTLKLKLEKIQKEIESQTETQKTLTSDIKEKNDILVSITDKIKEKENERDILQNDFNRFVKEKDIEKSNILLEIKIEKDKIQKPMELLAEANFFIDRKKKNLDTLIARFRKEFGKLHPELEYPI